MNHRWLIDWLEHVLQFWLLIQGSWVVLLSRASAWQWVTQQQLLGWFSRVSPPAISRLILCRLFVANWYPEFIELTHVLLLQGTHPLPTPTSEIDGIQSNTKYSTSCYGGTLWTTCCGKSKEFNQNILRFWHVKYIFVQSNIQKSL